jgi:hypothetical protein
MKWKLKPKNDLESRLGEFRIVERFLWYPMLLEREWRWLERTKIIQTVVRMDVGGSMEWGNYKYGWVSVAWGLARKGKTK